MFYLICAAKQGDTFKVGMMRGKTLEDRDRDKEKDGERDTIAYLDLISKYDIILSYTSHYSYEEQ